MPPKRRLFLSVPAISRDSVEVRSSMDSFSSGVDSPDNIASLTMHAPWRRRRSQGRPDSSLDRTVTSKYISARLAEGEEGAYLWRQGHPEADHLFVFQSRLNFYRH